MATRKVQSNSNTQSVATKATVSRGRGKQRTIFTAEQLASQYGVSGKVFRKWLRSGDTVIGVNDGKYTRYGFDADAKATRELLKQADERFGKPAVVRQARQRKAQQQTS